MYMIYDYIPFSTPSMIAEINKIDSIVYDSSNKLTNHLVGREIKFVNNKNKFLFELNNIFKKLMFDRLKKLFL